MNRILLAFLFWATASWCMVAQAQNYAVTFQVDMSKQTVSPNGVHVAGNFQAAAGYVNDWNPSISPMTDADGDGIYELSVSIPAGTYQYKFINGNAWGADENAIPAGCNVSGNRQVVITQNEVLPAFCFNSCTVCSPPTFNVTFRVDMSQQNVSPNGVFIAGNFQQAAGFANNWDPSATQMTDANADSIYEVKVKIPAGTYQYKFINGNAWGADENLAGASCQVNNNRQVTITADRKLSGICFGSCFVCNYVPPKYAVTFQVDMSKETVSPNGVHIAGNFQAAAGFANDWNPSISPMTDADGNGIYELTVNLPSGNYEYKFINGNAWGADENLSNTNCQVNDNRSLTVVNKKLTTKLVCFQKCETCCAHLPLGSYILHSTDTICAGSNTMLTLKNQGLWVAYYTLNNAAQSIASDSTANNIGALIAPTKTTKYVALVTDSASGCTVRDTFTIRVKSCCVTTPPADFQAFPVSATAAQLTWTLQTATVANYYIRYRLANTSGAYTYKTYAATISKPQLTGLTAGATYEIALQTKCTATTASDWTTTQMLKMPAPNDPCASPSTMIVTFLNGGKAKLTWQFVQPASSYQIRYREVGTTAWKSKTTTSALTNLTLSFVAGKTYEAQVRAKCGSTTTSYSSSLVFTIPSATQNITNTPSINQTETLFNQTSSISNNSAALFIFPNPATDVLTVQLDATASETLVIRDIMGKTIRTVVVTNDIMSLPLTDLTNGVYTLTNICKNGTKTTILFAKQ